MRTSIVQPLPKKMNENISNYYSELGELFCEMSDHSHFCNLGYRKKGQRLRSLREAQEQLIRTVIEVGKFENHMRILDVGCGFGGPAILVSDENKCRVIGIDLGKFQIEKTVESLKKLSNKNKVIVLYGDSHRLPFKGRTFDRIYSVESAFHYPDKSQFIKESARALKKNGLLIVADILKRKGQNESWLSGRIGRALAADDFFDTKSYRIAAAKTGLKLMCEKNISPGVRRVFLLWIIAFFKNIKNLLKIYHSSTLLKIGLALLTAPLLIACTSFHYKILVFGFEQR